MERTKAEEALFAERAKLLDRYPPTRADRLRLAEIDAALEGIPTERDPESQAIFDVIKDTADFFRKRGDASHERCDMIERLRAENYKLRERVIDLERDPELPTGRLRRFEEVLQRARDVVYHWGESSRKDFRTEVAVLEAAIDRLDEFDREKREDEPCR